MLSGKILPAYVWTIFVFLLCSMPGKAIPKFSWLELISFDKFVHAGIFFMLQQLYIHGFSTQNKNMFLKKNYLIFPLVFCILFGASLEIMQSKIFSERSGDLGDFIANTIGVILGTILYPKTKAVLIRFYDLIKI
jgi:VanZ family protein